MDGQVRVLAIADCPWKDTHELVEDLKDERDAFSVSREQADGGVPTHSLVDRGCIRQDQQKRFDEYHGAAMESRERLYMRMVFRLCF